MNAPSTRSKLLAMTAVSMLVMIDATATAVFVNNMGLAMEANPIMRYVLAETGIMGMFVAKGIGLSIYWSAMRMWKDYTGKEYSLIPDLALIAIFIPVCLGGIGMAVASS